MRFKRFTFSLLSPMVGVHVGRNPVSGQRFIHIAPLPFFGIDFELAPYTHEENSRKLWTEITKQAEHTLRMQKWTVGIMTCDVCGQAYVKYVSEAGTEIEYNDCYDIREVPSGVRVLTLSCENDHTARFKVTKAGTERMHG